MKIKKKSRYYLSSVISLVIFLALTLIIYYKWTNDYNERLKELNEYHAWLKKRVEQDSIRQLLYIFWYMPIISFIYWLLEWNKKYRFIIPLITAIVAFFLEYFASDWWKHIWEALPWDNFITIWIPSFIAALIWIWINRIIFAIIKAIKSKNKK